MAQSGNKIAASIIIGFLLLAGVYLYTSGRAPSVSLQLGQQQQPSGQQIGVPGFSAGNCPTTGQTTLTIDLKNGEDTTADTTFDASGYFFGSKGSYVAVTDTTSGSATLNCGETYTFKLVSADGNNQDNAKITGIEQGIGATWNPDGSVTFTPAAATYYLKVVGSKHGVLEFRVWGVDNGAYRYWNVGNVNGWNLTGAYANGTTSNSTTLSVGSGGRFTDEVHFRANQTDTNVADFGYWVMIDAATSVWNEPTVKLDGITLTNQKGLMNPDENRQYGSTYEYAYKIDGKITDSEHILRIEFSAISGIDPTATNSPVVAIAPIGAYKATSSNTVNIAACKDDSAATAVFALQSLTLGVV